MKHTKHLIQCHCILPQFRNRKDPVFHQFVVFSEFDAETDQVIPKLAQCNNCGVIHKIIDICKSEIIHNKEDVTSIVTISDLKMFMPKDVVSILEAHQSDLPTWEQAKFVYDNELWEEKVVITKDEVDGILQIKALIFKDENKLNVKTFTRQEYLENE
jgi:hypothetical protein